MRCAALALGVFVCAALPAVAAAQTMPTVEARRDWSVGVQADGYYDSNVSRSSAALAAQRGLAREDYLFTPAATFSFVQPFGRQAVFVNGDAGYTFYRRNSELDRRRANVTGGLAAVLGPCRQVTYGAYSAAQSDLMNLDAATTKNLRESVTVAAGLQCTRAAGPGGGVQVQRVDTKNSASTLDESDTTTETAILTLSYGRPSLGTLNVGFNYSNTEFPNRIIPGRPVGDGFFVQVYTLGYQRDFGSRLRVSGSGGISHVKREFSPPGVEQSFNTAAYSADIIYGLGRRIDLEFHGSRAVVPSQQVGKTFDKRTSAEAVVRYRAGSRLTFSTGYLWQDLDSNVDTASALLVVTDSRSDTVYASVVYRPNTTFSLQLDVKHEEREANLPDFNYSATRVGVRAQASF